MLHHFFFAGAAFFALDAFGAAAFFAIAERAVRVRREKDESCRRPASIIFRAAAALLHAAARTSRAGAWAHSAAPLQTMLGDVNPAAAANPFGMTERC